MFIYKSSYTVALPILKHPSTFVLTSLIMSLLMFFMFITNAHALNFVDQNRNPPSIAQNALGVGYFNAPVVYRYDDGSKESYLSNYNGYLLKYMRYFNASSAMEVHYLQANGEENIREISGSLLYGFNLGGPSLGAYVGISYTYRQRAQLAGEPRLSSEKAYGWDYPIGVKMKGPTLTYSVETRYKYFVLEGNNISADSIRYPIYFSVMMGF